MKCANPLCNTETMYLRSGCLYEVDFPVDVSNPVERQTAQRRIIWLCEICSHQFAVETWRPPGRQMRPLRDSFSNSENGNGL